MNQLRAAVVIATYNGARYLDAQLASLSTQTRRPDLVVLRDDGSTDDSVDRVVRWARASAVELQVVTAHEWLGPARSFLHALHAASPADVFLFCDQDDVWSPHKVERAVSALECIDDSRPHLVATRVEVVDAELNPLGLSAIPSHLSFGSAVCESVLAGCTMAMNGALRKLLVRELPRQLQMHDWWCYLLASGAGGITFDAEPSLKYRQHGANAVGVGTHGWAHARARLTRFFGPQSLVRSRQLEEFARLHAGDIRPDAVALLRQLLAANKSMTARLDAAIASPIRRQSLAGVLTTRVALLTNRF